MPSNAQWDSDHFEYTVSYNDYVDDEKQVWYEDTYWSHAGRIINTKTDELIADIYGTLTEKIIVCNKASDTGRLLSVLAAFSYDDSAKILSEYDVVPQI